MPPAMTLVLGSDPDVVLAGSALLAKGNAVDAVVGGVFAAAGLHASVLLGPLQMLIGGSGAGLRAVDGRNRQPGLGNPRPRGFLASEAIPAAARVGVPALPAALLAASTTYGKLAGAALLAPAIELARARSSLRAGALERVAQRGPAALSERVLADELVAGAGRLAGGLLSQRDLDELRPTIVSAASRVALGGRDVLTVPWGGAAVSDANAPSLSGATTRVLVAADRNGLLAVACYSVGGEGLDLGDLDLVAPFTATPVLRGTPRVRPGEPRSAAAPIALGRAEGVVDLAAGIGATLDAEGALRAWLEAYAPASDLTREGSVPAGLVAVQRAGSAWAHLSGETGGT